MDFIKSLADLSCISGVLHMYVSFGVENSQIAWGKHSDVYAFIYMVAGLQD
jgi:hypothetical protein